MATLEDLRKRIEEKEKKSKKKKMDGPKEEVESVDMDAVDKIVRKMKKKYSSDGFAYDTGVGGELGKIRGIIAEEENAEMEVQKVEDLREFKSPLIKNLGGTYLKMQKLLSPIVKIIKKMPGLDKLGYYMYSANMKYSVQQYLALVVAGAFVAFLVGFFGSFAWLWIMYPVFKIDLVMSVAIAILIAFVAMFFVIVLGVLIPRSAARKRGDEISIELPFALRHMATELRAGIGLYKTLQTIAVADYGVLSEEFAKTINEVEEGTDTRDALKHFAMRTESHALKDSLLHIIRALKTGGNLSEVMTSIAEDVSFEMRMKLREFAEKMNFFGVIFIVGAIVFPVMVAILSGITNAPIQASFMAGINPLMVLVFYIIVMPMMLILLVAYLKMSQPKV